MKKELACAGVILWMIVIFYLSHQPAHVSNELSKGVAMVVSKNFEIVSSGVDFNLGNFNHIIRKYAHFLLYCVLGLFVISMLKKYGLVGLKGIVFSIMICILFSISDEWHQLFVPGRGAQVSDVLIDSAGAIVGIIGYTGIGWLKELKRTGSLYQRE
nr:VanZ family protein [Lysinibacillus timonensis]